MTDDILGNRRYLHSIVKVNGYDWKVFFTQEANYVGVCDELNLTMEGKTEGEMFENIIHSLALLNEDNKNP